MPNRNQHTQAFALKSKDDAEREQSTSGGVFPLLARTILDVGGIIYGAAYDNDFSVRHIAVEDSENLPFSSKDQVCAEYTRQDILRSGRAVEGRTAGFVFRNTMSVRRAESISRKRV